MSHLHDLHCHIDLYPDYRELIEESEQAGIYTLAVTNTPSVFRACASLTQGKRFVRPALGLHPELAQQRHTEMALLRELLSETRYVGEVGLDFVTSDLEVRALQRTVFGAILEACAALGDRVLTVHSRRAARETIEMIGPRFPGTIILHWFSGAHAVLQGAIEYGYYFSINPSMLANATGRALVGQMPRERILLETDGPFVRVDHRPVRPRDLIRVVVGLGELWQAPLSEVHTTLEQNLRTALLIARIATSESGES